MNHKFLFIIVLVLGLVLSACSSGQLATQAPGDEASIPAVGLAQQALATQFGISVEDVEINKVEEETWQDSCLGLGGPDESCLQVETPGYRMEFTVSGQTCEVRTNQDGTTVRSSCLTPATE